MSFLRLPATRRALFTPITQRRALSASVTRAVGKESSVHEDSAKRSDEAHKTKEQELAKQKKGENEWREEIASDSETAVKADKGHLDSSKESIEKLQEETKGQ